MTRKIKVLFTSRLRLAIHDARGNVPQIYTYDLLNSVVKQLSGNSGTQHILVDASGHPLYSWDADERQFHFTYDGLRRQLTKHITTFSGATKVLELMEYGESTIYDTLHNLRGQMYISYDGVGKKTITSYDFSGKPLITEQQLLQDYTITDVDWSSAPTLNTEVFTSYITYDALERHITETDAGNNVTRSEYDKNGMLFAVYLTPHGGSENDYVSGIYYDEKLRRKKIYYGNGTSTDYTFDPVTYMLIRIKTCKNIDIFQDLNYWYDPEGNITKVRDDAQRALYFNNAVTLPEMDYTYDALYRLIRATGREQIGAASFGSADNYNDSAWMGITHKGDDNNTQNYIQKYSYDGVGNILSLQHIADTASYTRDYIYDTLSNRLLSTEVGANTYNYDYDARGNIIQMPNLADMVYDSQNQLSTVDLGGGGDAYYQYSNGERERKVIVNGAIVEERIYLGGYEIFRKFVGSSLTIERTTVHIADETGRIAMLEVRTVGTDPAPASLVRYIYSNHLGTASLELDDTAAIISYEEYHPYGSTSYQAKNASINAIAKRYRFTGKERDEETGLYYIGARYYIPWLTRWAATDPINNEWYNIDEGHNERNLERHFTELTASDCEYCYANPVRFIDPTGEQATNNYTPSAGFPGSAAGSSQQIEEFVFKSPKATPKEPEKKPGFFRSIINKLEAVVQPVVNVVKKVSHAVEHVVQKVWNKVENVGRKIGHIAGKVWDGVKQAAHKVGQVASVAWEGIKEGVEGVATFLAFAMNTFASNILWGALRPDPDRSKHPGAARFGQFIGDVLSLIGGAIEFAAGASSLALSGATLALTGGGAAPISAGIALAGVALLGHSVGIAATVVNKQFAHKPKSQSTGSRKRTEGKHQKGLDRNTRDRGGAKGMKGYPNKRPPGHTGPWPPK